MRMAKVGAFNKRTMVLRNLLGRGLTLLERRENSSSKKLIISKKKIQEMQYVSSFKRCHLK